MARWIGNYRGLAALFMGAFPHFIFELGALLFAMDAQFGAPRPTRRLKNFQERPDADVARLRLPQMVEISAFERCG